MNSKERLQNKIRNRTALIGVVGLGYVGLPLAVEKAKMGFKVIGIEQNPQRVEMINQARNYIRDVIDEELNEMVKQGMITAVSSFEQLPCMDIIVICVPTPLTRNLTPDLQYVDSVSRQIKDYLRTGQLVTLESTTYPGTTEEIILPILLESGLEVEKDFFLAYSPERVDPGNQYFSTKNTSKVVGAVGAESLAVAVEFYSQTISRVIPVSCARAAELTKVFENTFRAVNIALVNEITLLCDRLEINVWEVLDAAFTKPFGIMAFYPGPGVGGHCIPVDPHYLEWKAKELNFSTHFIALAGETNRKMPEFVKDKTLRIVNRAGIPSAGARVLVLGVAYKKDIEDTRESPAIPLIKMLQNEMMDVLYYDPYIPQLQYGGLDMASSPLEAAVVESCDLVLIVTDHSNIDYQWVVDHAGRVFDTRNATHLVKRNRHKIILL